MTLCLLVTRGMFCLLITIANFWIQIKTDKRQDLAWIQTVWHCDSIHESMRDSLSFSRQTKLNQLFMKWSLFPKYMYLISPDYMYMYLLPVVKWILPSGLIQLTFDGSSYISQGQWIAKIFIMMYFSNKTVQWRHRWNAAFCKMQHFIWVFTDSHPVELQRFTEILSYRDTYSDNTRIVSWGQFMIRLRYSTLCYILEMNFKKIYFCTTGMLPYSHLIVLL